MVNLHIFIERGDDNKMTATPDMIYKKFKIYFHYDKEGDWIRTQIKNAKNILVASYDSMGLKLAERRARRFINKYGKIIEKRGW